MAEPKTKVNDASVKDFLNSIEEESKRKDSFTLLEMFEKATSQEAKMWGTSIVGFGKYHYKSERSSQEGDWMLVGFSPRKANLTLYIHPQGLGPTLKNLGKHKTSMGCVYINKLSDVNLKVLESLISEAFQTAKKTHGTVD